MKNLLLASLVLSSLTFGTAFAGNEKGNGGGVHVCNNGTVEMYDLYEGYTRYNFTPDVDNSLTIEGYLNRASKKVDKIHPGIGLKLKKEISYLLKEQHLLVRSNLNLKLIEDANILVVGNGCSYKQLANWDDRSGNVIVNANYYNRLDTINQAALYLHEALYKLDREYFSAYTSDDIRPIVANLLSDNEEVMTIADWGKKIEPVQVNEQDEELKIIKSNSKSMHLELQLGDINFYDSKNKVEVIIIKDFSAAKNRMAEIEPQLKMLQTRIENLQTTISNIHSVFERAERKKRQPYYDQLSDLKEEANVLKLEYNSLKPLADLGITRKEFIIERPGYGAGVTYTFQQIESVGKKLVLTVIVKVNDKVAFQETSTLVPSEGYFKDEVIVDKILQNKLK